VKGTDPDETVAKAIAHLGGISSIIKPNATVVIKPNAGHMAPRKQRQYIPGGGKGGDQGGSEGRPRQDRPARIFPPWDA
jgi:hypothetical protein